MTILKNIFLISILFWLFPNLSNNIQKKQISTKEKLKYIFIGHCYQNGTEGNKVDYRLEKFDFSCYDGIWLGGDVCSEATLKFSTIKYLDELFNLSNPLTFWALGNHDTRNGNLEWVTQFTQRETYFVYNDNYLTSIVLNTTLVPVDCYNINKQFEIIENVCDTIEDSSHLILLMHHGLWADVPGLLPPGAYCHSNLRYWNANCNDVNSNFVNAVYPLLVEVKNRGIEVICIMGDVGANKKKFEMISTDGIIFLGCGLYHNSPDDYVLIFEHEPAKRKLEWKFCNLDSLMNYRN